MKYYSLVSIKAIVQNKHWSGWQMTSWWQLMPAPHPFSFFWICPPPLTPLSITFYCTVYAPPLALMIPHTTGSPHISLGEPNMLHWEKPNKTRSMSPVGFPRAKSYDPLYLCYTCLPLVTSSTGMVSHFIAMRMAPSSIWKEALSICYSYKLREGDKGVNEA